MLTIPPMALLHNKTLISLFAVLLHLLLILGFLNPSLSSSSSSTFSGQVGTRILYEDSLVKVWEFILPPGASTTLHEHSHDYVFYAARGSTLKVTGERGEHLFTFSPETGSTLKLEKHGDFLLGEGGAELPWKVPVVHRAENIGEGDYLEVLVELKGYGSGGKWEL